MFKIKYPIIDDKKECSNCGLIKPLSEFYKYKNYYRSYCKICAYNHTISRRNNPIKRAHDNEKLREKWQTNPEIRKKKYEYTKDKIKKNKLKAVEYKGGKCKICGYDKCISALEFHHLNPKEKERNAWNGSFDRRISFNRIKIELDKCILVCANCHREIHFNHE